MTKNLALTPVERDFFKTVAQAAFANPFSQSRVDLDRSIAACSESLSWDELVERGTQRVAARGRPGSGHLAAANASAKSSLMSSMCSMPTETRT